MTKSDKRQIENLVHVHANLHLAGISRESFEGIAARTVSSLIRAAMTSKSQKELLVVASQLGVTTHPDFIV